LPANVLAVIHPTTAAVSEVADVEEAVAAAAAADSEAVVEEDEAAAEEEAHVTAAAKVVTCRVNVPINQAEEAAAVAAAFVRTTEADTIVTMIDAAAAVVAADHLATNAVKPVILLVIVPMLEEDAVVVEEAAAVEIANVFLAENLGIFRVNAPAAAKFNVMDVARAATFLAIVRTPTTIVITALTLQTHLIRKTMFECTRRLVGEDFFSFFSFYFRFPFVG